MDTDRPARRQNRQSLRALRRDRAAGISIFCSHDAAGLAAMQAAALA